MVLYGLYMFFPPQSRFPTTAMREEVGRAIGLSARKVQVHLPLVFAVRRLTKGAPLFSDMVSGELVAHSGFPESDRFS